LGCSGAAFIDAEGSTPPTSPLASKSTGISRTPKTKAPAPTTPLRNPRRLTFSMEIMRPPEELRPDDATELYDHATRACTRCQHATSYRHFEWLQAQPRRSASPATAYSSGESRQPVASPRPTYSVAKAIPTCELSDHAAQGG